ncbi:MAG: transglutaminase-like domain-containing protein, partial [Anaerolineae bacterium]|nr:transglutaminase-like domain-containing protein [Anaerolineae bacterium]
MATAQGMRPVQPASQGRARVRHQRRRRLRNTLRTIFARGDFSSLLITWGMMIVTGLALDAAEWTEGLHVLAYVNFFAVGFGFLLSRSHYSELFALILSSIYSIAVIMLINAVLLVDHGSVWQRVDTLLHQLWVWFNEAVSGDQPVNNEIAFVVFLSILFWFLGHNAAWHVFRVDRVWRVIVPTGLVIVTNQFYYQGDNPLDIYLILFVIFSLLLLIRSHIETREYDWFIHRISFPNYVRRTFFQAGGVLAIVLVLVAWSAPAGDDDKSLARVKDLLSGETFTELAELWNRLFASVEGHGIATTDYYGGNDLPIEGPVQLGDAPVMYVQAPYGPRYYWRSTVYDLYGFEEGKWRWRHVRTVRAFTQEAGLKLNIGEVIAGTRRDVNQTITLLMPASRLIYAAPQPVEFGLPVEAELDCVEDLQRVCVNENKEVDVAIIRARETLRRGDHYTVRSSISAASADQLRNAGETYPSWVLRLYLQGANEVSPRIRDLAFQIVAEAGAQTPYDRAKAIESWLRTYIQYNESISAPPRGSDPMEWFLFETREG